MKITQLELYEHHSQALLAIKTDTVLIGWGEVVETSGIVSFDQLKINLEILAPAIIDQDPRLVRKIYMAMDATLPEQRSLKAAIDLACWDLWGQAQNLPLYNLLGGHFDEPLEWAALCTNNDPATATSVVAKAQENGYHTVHLLMTGDHFQDIELIKTTRTTLKPDQHLIADAQGRWQLDDARKVFNATRHIDVAF